MHQRVEALAQGAVPTTAPAVYGEELNRSLAEAGAVPTTVTALGADGEELNRSPAEAGVAPTTEPLPTTGALVPTTAPAPAAGGDELDLSPNEAGIVPTTDPLPTTGGVPTTAPAADGVVPTTDPLPTTGGVPTTAPAADGVVPTTEPLPNTGAVPTTRVPAAGGGEQASAPLGAESLPTTPGPQDPVPTTAEEPVAPSPSFPTVLPRNSWGVLSQGPLGGGRPGGGQYTLRGELDGHPDRGHGAGPAGFCRPYLGGTSEAPLSSGHRPSSPPVNNGTNCRVKYSCHTGQLVCPHAAGDQSLGHEVDSVQLS